MSEENKMPSTTSQKEKEMAQKKSERSVVRYISVLFGAAFALLLFTFVMEMRQHQQAISESQAQISDLKEISTSATQRLQDVLDENKALKEKLDEAEKTENALEEVQAQAAELDRSVRAMDWFWQINEAYTRNRYSLARKLIESLEADGLQECLPRESITENGRFSPYDRFMEIREKVVK